VKKKLFYQASDAGLAGPPECQQSGGWLAKLHEATLGCLGSTVSNSSSYLKPSLELMTQAFLSASQPVLAAQNTNDLRSVVTARGV
jgi:hypothetical protein